MAKKSADKAWRQQLPVLVAESQAVGSIAVIRSLGRAGYPVHACACRPGALGFYSSFANFTVVCPEYQSVTFLPWLRRYIDEHDISCIVPSEGFLLAIRSAFDEFASFLPYSRNKATVYSGLSKFDLFATLSRRHDFKRDPPPHLPPFLLFDSSRPVSEDEALVRLGHPLFLKVDGIYANHGEAGATLKAETIEEAKVLIKDLNETFTKGLVQGFVPGRGVGAFVLLWHGAVLGKFMHLRLHEVPHTGGVSSYRMSWWHDAIMEDAVANLQKMNWHGVAMMEYRWNPHDNRFYLIEMNGRFWGSLHLALHAGVDFPLLLIDAFHGRPTTTVVENRNPIRCRNTFPSEVQYVLSCLKDPHLNLADRIWPVVEFFLLMINPRVKSDLWFPNDRKIYWHRLLRFLKTMA